MSLLRRCFSAATNTSLRKFRYFSMQSHIQDDARGKYYKELILKETKVSTLHLTPDIALYLITPECRLFTEPQIPGTLKTFPNDPFWGFYWPGGQALSKYLLEHPEVIRGKSVLDIGSGCGATSLAALKCDAKYAVANDIDDIAGYAALLNASLNKIPQDKLKISVVNLIGNPPETISEDVLFLGDVFYDAQFAESLIPWLNALRAQGKEIYVGDPGRHGLTERRQSLLTKLATYELTENCCIENLGFRYVNVWQFK